MRATSLQDNLNLNLDQDEECPFYRNILQSCDRNVNKKEKERAMEMIFENIEH